MARTKIKQPNFVNFLLRVGEGRETTYPDENGKKTCIKIPNDMLIEEHEQNLIDITYPDIENR